MKRNLFGNVRPFGMESGAVIDRQRFLSGVLSASITEAPAEGATLKITLEHCKTADGTFTKVLDERLFMDATKEKHAADGLLEEVYIEVPASKGSLVMVDIDLLGCQQYIKVKATLTGAGAAASFVFVLGDSDYFPA